MKSNTIMTAAFGIICGAVLYAGAEDGGNKMALGGLTETNEMISSINMKENFGEAGKILDRFYSGADKKGGSPSPAGYVETGGSLRTLAQAEKELCNAESHKISGRASKVPALASGSGSVRENGNRSDAVAKTVDGLSKEETSVIGTAIAGAVTGAMVGAVAGGGGALPGAIAGAIIGGAGAAVSNVVAAIITGVSQG